MCDWIWNRNETCLDLPSGACRQRTFLSPAGANSRNWNVKAALLAATATKPVQAATVNKSLQFRRRLRDFFAPVWGLPLVAVYVPVHNKIRSEGFAVAANISRRSGGAFIEFAGVHYRIIEFNGVHYRTIESLGVHYRIIEFAECVMEFFSSLECTIELFRSLECTIELFSSLECAIELFSSLDCTIELFRSRECTKELLSSLECTIELFSLLECTIELLSLVKWTIELLSSLKCTTELFSSLECTIELFSLLECTIELLSLVKWTIELLSSLECTTELLSYWHFGRLSLFIFWIWAIRGFGICIWMIYIGEAEGFKNTVKILDCSASSILVEFTDTYLLSVCLSVYLRTTDYLKIKVLLTADNYFWILYPTVSN